ISRKTSYLLGEAWNNGNAASYSWLAEMDSASMVEELAKRDPIFDVYGETDLSLAVNDVAKDLMVATGKDSLFNNGMNAQRNFNMNYNIPASPAPPTVFAVNSQAENILLTWRYDNGVPSDVAGFKIYRASGADVFEKAGGIALGDWQLHDSVGASDTLYEDTEGVTPGADYYYALTAVNDQGIESGMFLTKTTQPARLSREVSDSLEMVRVVPNPLNINNATLGRYAEGDGNKLTFVNLPGPCWITIMTESGELVTKIDHNTETGIAQWYDGQRYLITDSDQLPVSGIYIAHIQEKATGKSVF
ncbi:MAG: fibronectin type III domain-containing protein, partial [candidate division WOR-3 bacterium]